MIAKPSYHPFSIALKRLLNQLFTSDAQLFDVHSLATLFLAAAKEYGVGSCVKVDGPESDPYAYLSVVDLASKAVSGLSAALVRCNHADMTGCYRATQLSLHFSNTS
jgi:hypothetical protein